MAPGSERTPRRRGPRTGGEDTRTEILEAARAEFAAKGYDGATLRGIARTAGVDPRLVHHYFDGKQSVFQEVLHMPVHLEEVIESVFAAGPDNLGERVLRTFFAVWDAPAASERLVAFVAASSFDHRCRADHAAVPQRRDAEPDQPVRRGRRPAAARVAHRIAAARRRHRPVRPQNRAVGLGRPGRRSSRSSRRPSSAICTATPTRAHESGSPRRPTCGIRCVHRATPGTIFPHVMNTSSSARPGGRHRAPCRSCAGTAPSSKTSTCGFRAARSSGCSVPTAAARPR